MSTVTYKNQPAIQQTHGNVPLVGTSHIYRVSEILWPEAVSEFLESLLLPPSLHVCCGLSSLGDIRLDQDWFMPIRPDGRFKKWADRWYLHEVYVWQPRTYFGRVQVVSVLERDDQEESDFARKGAQENGN